MENTRYVLNGGVFTFEQAEALKNLKKSYQESSHDVFTSQEKSGLIFERWRAENITGEAYNAGQLTTPIKDVMGEEPVAHNIPVRTDNSQSTFYPVVKSS